MTVHEPTRYASIGSSRGVTHVAADAKQSEVVKQINEAFQAAQARLAQLREAVERNTDLARANARATVLKDQKDRALKELGDLVYRQIQKGRLELPAGFASALKAIEAAEQAAEAHARELTDILREGEEVAERLKVGKNAPKPQTVLGPGNKKR
ncbi:aminoacyltransferase [Myxococcus llanfairpwllgwyngyllgogerychwyrndrobwllllantysiliogogogochensis]|uniref:Aminoacyltransferase n=1 Tax=Myxococcus llanfairpwllgwyngyllgogerychwyrndrobwllllantysiliogogogochensis TaxID=2590453 RepID=A0A540WTP3_9BACT|nr:MULTISPECIES: aminoacyltransferase [unclassified Myxococcus]TQF12383.1 aminoacyltransferase [Myxococcus llanfairpwllgwyngyllgogerychwyrndrobwllllantysiliogogogochensis]